MTQAITIEDVLAQYGRLDYCVKGISMLPLIRQRCDVITILPPPQGGCHVEDILLFKRDNGEYVLHRVMKVRENEYGMCGDNQAFIEWIRTDQVIGIMDTLYRNGTTLHVRRSEQSSPYPLWYRAYLFIWMDLYPVRFFFVKVEYKIRALMKRIKKL